MIFLPKRVYNFPVVEFRLVELSKERKYLLQIDPVVSHFLVGYVMLEGVSRPVWQMSVVNHVAVEFALKQNGWHHVSSLRRPVCKVFKRFGRFCLVCGRDVKKGLNVCGDCNV